MAKSLRERWDALCTSDQQKILDKHRYEINFHDDWWDCIFEQFIEDVNEFGYMVETHAGKRAGHCIWFSGFDSQGDGACFDGRVWDWGKAFKNFPVLLECRKLADDDDMHLSWKSHGNYSHSNTLWFDETFDIGNEFDNTIERIRWMARESQIDEAEAEWEKFVAHTETHVKELCGKLYDDLKEENDRLSDDEAVLESLIANELLEDEIKEYEDDEDNKPESLGPPHCCADQSPSGSLFLWPTGHAFETDGGPDHPDDGSGREAHLLQP